MIDYKKLAKAHELIKKLPNHQASYYFGDVQKEDSFTLWEDWGTEEDFETIDELIAKLEELTKPKPKYAVGQEVWYSCGGGKTVRMAYIDSITYESRGILYHFGRPYYSGAFEIDCYPSREALIEAQIRYWTGIKQEQIIPISECPHETGQIASTVLAKDIICIRCFEHIHKSKIYECPHEYTLESGFRCVKCGENRYTKQREIQPAPVEGNIPPEDIQRAVEYVTKLRRERETCKHHWVGDRLQITHCKLCGEFYR